MLHAPLLGPRQHPADLLADHAALTERAPSEADLALLWSAAAVDADLPRVADAARDADIDLVLDAASRQRVAPLVLHNLSAAGIDVERPSLAGLWAARAQLALPRAARAALEPLDGAGLRPIALKGLALLDRYPDPALRPMDDIDLLLPSPLARRGVDVLRHAGWRPIDPAISDPGYHTVLQNRSVPGVPLELHTQLERRRERIRALDARRLWASRVPSTALGMPVWGLPAELEFMVLVAHAAKRFHIFNRMIWIVDLTVVARAAAFDWDEVGRIATTANRRTALAIALRLAHRLGADVPNDLTSLPPVLTRAGAFDRVLDPARPFAREDPVSRWLSLLVVDNQVGRLKLGAAELALPRAPRRRREVVSDVASEVTRWVPRIAKAAIRR